jgi:hypothetical protein
MHELLGFNAKRRATGRWTAQASRYNTILIELDVLLSDCRRRFHLVYFQDSNPESIKEDCISVLLAVPSTGNPATGGGNERF